VTTDLLTNTERTLDTPNGRVFVRDMSGDDPPIVLLHGFPDDHRIYDNLLPRLWPRRAVAFDFVGYGRSERPGSPRVSAEEHGTEIDAVLDELGISRAVLVGHDASGPEAVIYAITHPDRVAHLVLLNTVFGHQPSLKLPEMIRLLADPALGPLADAIMGEDAQRLWLLQHTADRWGLDAVDPKGVAVGAILPQFFGDSDQPNALPAIRAWTSRLFDALDEQDELIRSGALARLAVPVSIVFGQEDSYLNPELAAEIAGLFDHPSVHLVPGAGHWPQHDQPALVAELLKHHEDSQLPMATPARANQRPADASRPLPTDDGRIRSTAETIDGARRRTRTWPGLLGGPDPATAAGNGVFGGPDPTTAAWNGVFGGPDPS
jgi:haloalkane dehalogenase